MENAKNMQSKQTSWSFVLIFAVLFVLAFFVMRVSTASADPSKYMKVTIHQGDTLWQIANHYEGKADMKRSQFIHWVETRNHVSSQRLIPGDKLVIPIEINASH